MKIRRRLAVLCGLWLAITVALPSMAQRDGIAEGSSEAKPGAEWFEYRPPDQGFRIELPGKPLLEDREVKTDSGPLINHQVMVGDKETAFNFTYADLPASMSSQPMNVTLKKARNGVVAKNPVSSENDLTIAGFPAKRLVFYIQDKGFNAHVLIVVKNLRLYEAIHIVRPGKENPAAIERFLSSFQLL